MGIGADALRNLIARKGIAHVRNDNGRLLGVFEADCDAWVERHREAATEGPDPSRAARRDVDAQVEALVAPDERIW
jgi:hypothetical protein